MLDSTRNRYQKINKNSFEITCPRALKRPSKRNKKENCRTLMYFNVQCTPPEYRYEDYAYLRGLMQSAMN